MDTNTTRELVSFLHDQKTILPETLFHYTAKENVPLIFTDDCISFLLTNAEFFDDKLEGKTITSHYRMAVEELFQSRIISEEDVKILESVRSAPLSYYLQVEWQSGKIKASKTYEVDTFVGCFSKKKNDPYMIQHYIKNEGNEGICFEVMSNGLIDSMHQIKRYSGLRVSVEEVLYGHDIEEHLKKYIMDLIEKIGCVNSSRFSQLGLGLLRNELRNTTYRAKEEEYREENEYRIIIQIPKNEPEILKINEFETIPRGILLKIHKNRLSCIDYFILDDIERTNNEKMLRKLGYMHID